MQNQIHEQVLVGVWIMSPEDRAVANTDFTDRPEWTDRMNILTEWLTERMTNWLTENPKRDRGGLVRRILTDIWLLASNLLQFFFPPFCFYFPFKRKLRAWQFAIIQKKKEYIYISRYIQVREQKRRSDQRTEVKLWPTWKLMEQWSDGDRKKKNKGEKSEMEITAAVAAPTFAAKSAAGKELLRQKGIARGWPGLPLFFALIFRSVFLLMKAVQSIWLAANRGSPTSSAWTQFPVPVADPIFSDGTFMRKHYDLYVPFKIC